MKKWFVLSAVFIAALSVSAAIEVRVCDPNDLRPLGIDEIMMGTQVSLVVYADAKDLWSGGLFIHDAHRGRGVLRVRNSADPNAPAGAASCLEAAGEMAFVRGWNDSLMSGFDLYTDDFARQAGNWFVLDYTPLAEGECTIHFYDHSQSFTVADPNLQVSLLNSPTRDWNDDGTVDLADYAVLASHWLAQDCVESDWCGGADLDRNGSVGIVDLLMFADFWLWGTPNWQGATELLPPAAPQDPNVFYAVIDPNGLAEVSIPVGQSIRLYLDKTTLGQDVYVFSLEVNLSDPNLGWIDNTEYDPNDIYGSGTAEILATPRSTFFDYWGPGYTQYEGIQFVAASFSGPMDDGLIASFVYTPTAVGTATLKLIDYMDGAATELRSLVLHQYDPEEPEMMMSGMLEGGEAMMLSTSSESAEPVSQETVDEILSYLETLYEESPELRETIEEERWQEFIDAVKASADTESLAY